MLATGVQEAVFLEFKTAQEIRSTTSVKSIFSLLQETSISVHGWHFRSKAYIVVHSFYKEKHIVSQVFPFVQMLIYSENELRYKNKLQNFLQYGNKQKNKTVARL